MASLKITAPDGKTLRIQIPQGTDPSQYESMVNEVVSHYMASNGSALPQGMAGSAPQLQGDLTPSTESSDVTDQGNETRSSIGTALGKAGTAVEAGGAGIGDLASGNGLAQAGVDVNKVLNEQAPETTAAKVGKFTGSFFTPAQIALQALGGAVAKPIVGAVGNVAAPAIKGLVNAFPKISDFVGAAPEAVSALVDNPEAVAAAKKLPQVAEDVASTVQGLSQEGMNAAAAGKELLSNTAKVPGVKDQIMRLAAKMANDPLAQEGDKVAADYVSNVAKQLKNSPTEQEVGNLIDSLDEKINTKWNKANPGPMTGAQEEIRRILSRALQGQNSQYAQAMSKASSTFEPVNTLTKSLGLGEGAAGDTTVNALRKVTNPDALATQRALASFPGLSDMVANAAAKDALQQTLLGKSALNLAPYLSPLATGAIQALPASGNAAAQFYQGLSD